MRYGKDIVYRILTLIQHFSAMQELITADLRVHTIDILDRNYGCGEILLHSFLFFIKLYTIEYKISIIYYNNGCITDCIFSGLVEVAND